MHNSHLLMIFLFMKNCFKKIDEKLSVTYCLQLLRKFLSVSIEFVQVLHYNAIFVKKKVMRSLF